MLRKLLREPLVHFLVIGFGLFAIFGYVSKDQRSDPANRIVVDRDRLLTFMGYRYKNPTVDSYEDMLDNLPEQELQTLIEDYAREEALYREAKALNLDKDDYTLRRRLIRQLEFINQGLISSILTLSESDLKDYLGSQKDRYYVPPKITFTHVFFNRERHGDDPAQALAQKELKVLNDGRVPFHEGLSHGDRYLYHRNYVNKDAGEIASHFGSDMQAQLFALDSDDQRWYGPFSSPYGYHLAMVTKRTAGYHPALEEIRQRIEQDAMQARLKEELDRITQTIVDAYEVQVAAGIQRGVLPAREGETRQR